MNQANEPTNFYVYAHIRNDDGRIFYIGKGSGNRAWVSRRRNPYWKSVSSKTGYTVKLLEEGLTEAEAFEKEVQLIASIGRENLCNLTDGGDGTSGYRMSEKQRDKVSKNLSGRPVSKETRERISKAQKGRKRPEHLVVALADMLRGRKASEETRKKISESNKGRVFTQETKDKISKAHKGKKASMEARKNMSIAHTGKKRAKSSKEKQSQTLIARAKNDKESAYGNIMKRIYCSNGMEFRSAREAGRWAKDNLGASDSAHGTIGRCASGSRKSAFGLTWSFVAKD